MLVAEKDLLNLYSTLGQFTRINADSVRLCGRTARGVRLFDLKDGEKLVAIGKIIQKSQQLEETEPQPEKQKLQQQAEQQETEQQETESGEDDLFA